MTAKEQLRTVVDEPAQPRQERRSHAARCPPPRTSAASSSHRRRPTAVWIAQACLEITDDHAEQPRREKPRPERTGRILTHRRELPQRCSDLRRHTPKLPADLLAHSLRPVGSGQASGFGGIRGSAQGVRTHVRDARGLTGCSRSDHRCGSTHLTRRRTTNETATDLLCDAELPTSERPRPGDGATGTTVSRSLRLEQSKHPLRALSGPRRDDSSVRFAQRLGRTHTQILPGASPCPRGSPRSRAS